MERYLTGRAVTLTHKFLNDESVLTPATVTVTVTREASPGTPVFTGTASQASGVYTVSPGLLPEGVYVAIWDGSTAIDTTVFEVVGGYLFSIPELRESDEDLDDPARYPTADVKQKRRVTEWEFQTITGRSFIPRTATVRLLADGSDWVWPGVYDIRKVVSAKGTDGVSVLDEISVDDIGGLTGFGCLPRGVYTLEIAYGFTFVPEDIKRVGMLRSRYHLMSEKSGIPDRATSFQPVDGGTYTLSTPGVRGAHTGIPEVDEVLRNYTYEILGAVSV